MRQEDNPYKRTFCSLWEIRVIIWMLPYLNILCIAKRNHTAQEMPHNLSTTFNYCAQSPESSQSLLTVNISRSTGIQHGSKGIHETTLMDTTADGWSADAEMLYSSTAFSCPSWPATVKPTLTSDRLTRHPVHCSTASVMIADSETIRHCWWTAPCSAVHVCVGILGPRWSTTW